MSPSRGDSRESHQSTTSRLTRRNPFSRTQLLRNPPSYARVAAAPPCGTSNVHEVPQPAPCASIMASEAWNPQSRWDAWGVADTCLDSSFIDIDSIFNAMVSRGADDYIAMPLDSTSSTSSKRKSVGDTCRRNKSCKLQDSVSPQDTSKRPNGSETSFDDSTNFQGIGDWATVSSLLLGRIPETREETPKGTTSGLPGFQEFLASTEGGRASGQEDIDQWWTQYVFAEDDSEFCMEPQQSEGEVLPYLSGDFPPGSKPLESLDGPSRHDSMLSETRSPRLSHALSTRSGRSQFVCATCGSSQPTEVQLECHAISLDHRAFRCNEPGCTHSTHRKDLLKRHKDYHKAPNEYECKYCDEYRGIDAFKRLDALDQHMKRMHPKEWESQLIKHCPHQDCEYAKSGFKFSSRVQYRSHMANVHGEGKTDCPVQGCKRIGKDGFKRVNDLQKHVETKHPLEMTEYPNPLQRAGLV